VNGLKKYTADWTENRWNNADKKPKRETIPQTAKCGQENKQRNWRNNAANPKRNPK